MKPYLLDTNALWEVLTAWNNGEKSDLLPLDLFKNSKYEFWIPEISIAEIYSVLGKKARAQKPQMVTCERKLADGSVCASTWIQGSNALFRKKDAQVFLHLIRSIILQNHTDFEVNIIPINHQIIAKAGILLQQYAIKYDFHSLDATVAATAALGNYRVVTFDKKLRTVLTLMDVELF